MQNKVPSVRPTAWVTMPWYCCSKTLEIAPRSTPSSAA